MSNQHPEIDLAKYVSFVSFRKSGIPVATPVWITRFEDGYGFTVESTSGKAKRLAHSAKSSIQQCNAKGRPLPGAQIYECASQVVIGHKAVQVRDAIAEKYGLTYKMFSIYLWFTTRFGKSAGLPDAAVVLKIVEKS